MPFLRTCHQTCLIPLAMVLLVLWAVAVSPVVIAWLFTSDNQIESALVRTVLWCASAGLLGVAVLIAGLSRSRWRRGASALSVTLLFATPVAAWFYWQANPNRHHWDQPQDALAALARMTVPEGFRVELVAAEPDVVNPVALAFDDRGRIWISESIEYPRRSAGPGEDRIKILEDTDADGRADKVTIFAEGLNMPTGLAIGHGGVWVLNAPDLLFLQDTDGDDRADTREVVLTGFGRNDPHELPSSLNWGPDGWLYGLNGISNPSKITHQGETFQFSCALYRLHPKTRKFQVFCEGTSNPWGLAWDTEGSAFVSSCVIDHLWHFAEGVYYRNQSGHYPPNAWPAPSIVKHQHQLAAYCGLEYYDSDAYPPPYRQRLYMGNLHGGCLNVDHLTRTGAGYFAEPDPDFLTANDGWFMPVAVKTGPEGILYVLDWYDRYHCHQDAERDPTGIDRLRGRLYRVLHANTRLTPPRNLGTESDDQLVNRLADGNAFVRRTAQRILQERLLADTAEPLRVRLEQTIVDPALDRRTRLTALWSLIGGSAVSDDFLLVLLSHDDPAFCAWAVRAAGDTGTATPEVLARLKTLASIPDPVVQAEIAIAARKLPGLDALNLLLDVLEHSPPDDLLPHLVWQQLAPLLPDGKEQFRARVEQIELNRAANLAALLPRAMQLLLDADGDDASSAAFVVELLAKNDPADLAVAQQSLQRLTERVQSGELSPAATMIWREALQPQLEKIITGPPTHPLHLTALCLLGSWKDPDALSELELIATNAAEPDANRALALTALLSGSPPEAAFELFKNHWDTFTATTGGLSAALFDGLARLEDPRIGELLIAQFARIAPELQTRAIELLTSRVAWAEQLLAAIEQNQIPATAVNLEQVRKLQALPSPDLVARAKTRFGTVRQERNPDRAEVVARMKKLLASNAGDAARGKLVFAKSCSQCHKFQNEGHLLGPDLTTNGRGSLDQLLSNVFDPNLVIGGTYQTRLVSTADGRVLTGLLAEENEHRIVLRMPGGKLETIPKGEVDELIESRVSLMPEGFERQLTPQDIADLFTFLLPKP